MTKSFSAPLESSRSPIKRRLTENLSQTPNKKNPKKKPRDHVVLHVSYNQWRTVCIAAKMSCKSEAAPGGLTQQSAQFGLKCSLRRGRFRVTDNDKRHGVSLPPPQKKPRRLAAALRWRKTKAPCQWWEGHTEPSLNTTMLVISSALKLKLKQEAARTSTSRCRTLTLSVALCWHWWWPGSL